MFGYTTSEAAGCPINDLIAPAELRREAACDGEAGRHGSNTGGHHRLAPRTDSSVDLTCSLFQFEPIAALS